MNKKWEKEFFEKLEKHFGTITQENALEERDDGEYVLRSLFSTVKGGTGLAVFESQLYPTNPEVLQLEIVVLPSFTLKDEVIGEIEKAVAHLNYYTPVGAFGVFYPDNNLFLRYVAILDQDRAIEELVEEINVLYNLLGVTLGNLYQVFEQINDGELTFEEAVEQEKLLKQS